MSNSKSSAVVTSNTIFGGSLGWHAKDWIDSDDRVRGGKSQSYLKPKDDCALFTGHLDISTLGGAGFASQRTTGEDRRWDLSGYDGVQIVLLPDKTDEKKYTFILKDELLPPDESTGREQSSVSWEFDFTRADGENVGDADDRKVVSIRWDEFEPTYRGREKKDAKPLRTGDVKRLSLMMRSFFGTQEGDFCLAVVEIRGLVEARSAIAKAAEAKDSESIVSYEKTAGGDVPRELESQSLLSWVRSCLRL